MTVPHEEAFISLMGIIAACDAATQGAKSALKKLSNEDILSFSAKDIAYLSEAALGAANLFREVANKVRKTTANKRGHLSVVEGQQ
jgi:hypothetical protein